MQLLQNKKVEGPFELQEVIALWYAEYWKRHSFFVLLLTGSLGAGKTTLTRSFMEILGIEESINSPTFNLMNEFSGTRGQLMHFDLYRLDSALELSGLDFKERWSGHKLLEQQAAEQQTCVQVIEWWQKAGIDFFSALALQKPVYEIEIHNPDHEQDPMSEIREVQLKQW